MIWYETHVRGEYEARYKRYTFKTWYSAHERVYMLDLQPPDAYSSRIGMYKTIGAARGQATRFKARIDNAISTKEQRRS